MRLLIILFALSAILFSCNQSPTSPTDDFTAKEVTPEGLAWYNIEDLDKMTDLGGKKVLVDMYTSWCGWCKVMDKKTFTDPEVVTYLNENYVLIKFNAEQREPITFKGETYEWTKRGRNGTNQLALKMMSGRAAYPTMVYLDENREVIQSVPGYKKPDQLLADLRKLETLTI